MKFLWVDATIGPTWEERKVLITSALEAGAKGILVRGEDLEKASALGSVDMVVDAGAGEETPEKAAILLVGRAGEGGGKVPLPKELDRSKDLARLRELKGKGRRTCGYVEIESKAHERLAALEGKVADYILVVGKDWKVIPLENLIAELQKAQVEVIAGVQDLGEARLALETLEVGVDGVLLQNPDPREIRGVAEAVSTATEAMSLKIGKIKTLSPVGMGDRVCVDTASILRVGEGMLIGSQGSGLFLVHSETLETEYVASRPFRVNAGAVHAYVLGPGMKTKYLSELKAGDEVLAVDWKGGTRRVVVGRVKIEKRPLLLLEAECEGKVYKTLLQNAETIMLVGKDGKPISISRLTVGDEILLHTKEVGRHFGMEVEESIIER